MATFTRTPEKFISSLGDAVYGFELEEQATVDLRITNAATGQLLSVRRFIDTLGAEVDIAPVIRRTAKATPQAGATALLATDDREVMVNVALRNVADGEIIATAPTRSFLATTNPLTPSSLYTRMPASRVMAPAESDFLLLHFGEVTPVTITAIRGRERTTTVLTPTTVGVKTLRIAASDFPEAEQLEVTAGDFCHVVYTLLPVPENSVRLAWRTACGSIEHYTFPIVVKRSVEAGTTTHLRHVVSAFETRPTAEAVAEIITSPEVWEVTAAGYRKVDILTDKAAVERDSLLSTVELTIRETEKSVAPWS